MKMSTGLRTSLLGGNSLSSVMNLGFIQIYSGTVPTDADQSIGSATLLTTIKSGSVGLTFGTAASGAIPKNPSETWNGVNVATGTASFYRHVGSADTGALSTTQPRMQGTCGTAGGDMAMTSVALTSGATQSVDAYSVGIPVGS